MNWGNFEGGQIGTLHNPDVGTAAVPEWSRSSSSPPPLSPSDLIEPEISPGKDNASHDQPKSHGKGSNDKANVLMADGASTFSTNRSSPDESYHGKHAAKSNEEDTLIEAPPAHASSWPDNASTLSPSDMKDDGTFPVENEMDGSRDRIEATRAWRESVTTVQTDIGSDGCGSLSSSDMRDDGTFFDRNDTNQTVVHTGVCNPPSQDVRTARASVMSDDPSTLSSSDMRDNGTFSYQHDASQLETYTAAVRAPRQAYVESITDDSNSPLSSSVMTEGGRCADEYGGQVLPISQEGTSTIMLDDVNPMQSIPKRRSKIHLPSLVTNQGPDKSQVIGFNNRPSRLKRSKKRRPAEVGFTLAGRPSTPKSEMNSFTDRSWKSATINWVESTFIARLAIQVTTLMGVKRVLISIVLVFITGLVAWSVRCVNCPNGRTHAIVNDGPGISSSASPQVASLASPHPPFLCDPPLPSAATTLGFLPEQMEIIRELLLTSSTLPICHFTSSSTSLSSSSPLSAAATGGGEALELAVIMQATHHLHASGCQNAMPLTAYTQLTTGLQSAAALWRNDGDADSDEIGSVLENNVSSARATVSVSQNDRHVLVHRLADRFAEQYELVMTGNYEQCEKENQHGEEGECMDRLGAAAGATAVRKEEVEGEKRERCTAALIVGLRFLEIVQEDSLGYLHSTAAAASATAATAATAFAEM